MDLEYSIVPSIDQYVDVAECTPPQPKKRGAPRRGGKARTDDPPDEEVETKTSGRDEYRPPVFGE